MGRIPDARAHVWLKKQRIKKPRLRNEDEADAETHQQYQMILRRKDPRYPRSACSLKKTQCVIIGGRAASYSNSMETG